MPVRSPPDALGTPATIARPSRVGLRRALLGLGDYVAALQDQLDQALVQGDLPVVAAIQNQAAGCARQLRVVDDRLRNVFIGTAARGRSLDTAALSRLTRRQRDVATCVAEGLTNELIATRLGIKGGTAANHVEHIRGRLGFTSRSQIAVWAVERGLYRSGQGPAV
jgi:DNA-binding NarL/FixJ family response regulator